ncbi:ATP-binding protein [Gordonia sp. CPCC 205515]|uniref:hypothetical protein n=1 Tax=Gordonia sp. CPCC 205515 TaxID=3140791 RepID=UPI003AF3E6AB
MNDAERTPRIADRLIAERRDRSALVGRRGELAVVARLLDDPDGPAVLYLHGPGGVGKSCLVRAAESLATERGRACCFVDGTDIGAQRSEVLRALRETDGLTADGVLIIDTFEAVGSLERWIRDEFLPGLPADCRVILAGRHPPAPQWRRDPAWRRLFVELPLRNLDPEDAVELLHRAGVPDDAADSLATQTYGHPLALTIAADTYGAGSAAPALPSLLGNPDVVKQLLAAFVDEVQTPQQRAGLHVCGHARRVDRALLRDVLDLDDGHADDLLTWLRDRPYAVAHPDGLTLHDLVRDALDADLRWRDRQAFGDLHRRIRRVVVQRMRRSDGLAYHRAAADLLFLHRNNPVTASLFSYDDLGSMSANLVGPDDAADVRAIFERAESPLRAQWAVQCAQALPEKCYLIRDDADTPCGAVVFARLDESGRFRATDPVSTRICAELSTLRPAEAGEVMLHQMAADAQGLDALGPVSNIVAEVSMREWASPGLGWVAISSTRGDLWSPVWDYIGFAALTELTLDDGATVTVYARDFLRCPFDEWLGSLAAAETGAAPPTSTPIGRVALCRADFDAAVRELLRDLHQPDRLRHSPLVGSRLATSEDRSSPDTTDAAADRLVDVLRHALTILADDPHYARAERALDRTFVHPAGSQERAAEVLGLAFSTYRRHLAKGVDRVAEVLWDWDLRGVPEPT